MSIASKCIVAILSVGILIACSDEDPPAGLDEMVSSPGRPEGSDTAYTTEPETYSTGGAVSSEGHALRYRFDFDADNNHDFSDWSSTFSASNAWPDTGTFTVKAQARCATHVQVVSEWSDRRRVTVVPAPVTRPPRPTGPETSSPGRVEVFCTDGSVCNEGGAVEYRFDFDAEGGHAYSNWDTLACVNYSWSGWGNKIVKAQARCASYPETISSWSDGLLVEVISLTGDPVIRFATTITEIRNGIETTITKPYVHSEIPQDTVGMFRPFVISYHGIPASGSIAGYRFYPLSSGIVIEGQDEWTADLSDTLRVFSNVGDETIPASRHDQPFALAAQCKDDSGRVSAIDEATGDPGVARVIVNFDPDTRIEAASNQYTVGGIQYSRQIDFTDGIPDTVPYKSWVTLFYTGWDDPRDGVLCSPTDLDECIDYQVRFVMERHTEEGDFNADSNWLPRGDVHDTNPTGVEDSNSVRIGTYEYDIYVQTVDENGRGDGGRIKEKAASIPIVGNYDPVFDSLAVEDHFGRRLDLSVVDTLTWNFWKGEGWPYTCWCDTVDLGTPSCPDHPCPPGSGSLDFFKTFSFRVKGWGHDNPRDPDGSGVKAWRYEVFNSAGQPLNIGSGGGIWITAETLNEFEELIRVRFQYPGPFSPLGDPMGDSVFANLPSWFDDDLTFVIRGRDTASSLDEPRFEQLVFLNGLMVPAGSFNASNNGRLTEEKTFTFHLRLVRP